MTSAFINPFSKSVCITLAACRDNGKLRIEGKEYIVKDGDVMHFRFNV